MTSPEKGPIVGIDLGTTYSLVAVLADGVPTVIRNELGEALTPSAVSVDEDGAVLVGAAARARAATHPDRTALAFKRDMGTDRRLSLGGRTMAPEELSSLVLASLKAQAEAALGVPIEEAVVTVPAYFGDLQRQATRDAARIAGLRVERIINEPTAAALAYGLGARTQEKRVAVLDLGGGTFDVTLLEIIEGVIEIQASAGDLRLGGEDFVDALVDVVSKRIAASHGRPRRGVAAARLREACELAKCRLSSSAEARVALPALSFVDGGVADVEVDVSRQEAELAWAPLLERMAGPIRRTLRDAAIRPEEIDEVLLVGGATRMPCVVDLASRVFGRLPRCDLSPDEAVALGAAVQAGLKQGDSAVEDLVVTDVAPFTLGIATGTRLGRQLVEGLFTPIIDRGTVIPASRVQTFSTIADEQEMLLVEVYQGEHSVCADNTKLGEYTLRGLPRGKAGSVGVDVRFTYDLNGILEVEMSVRGRPRTEHLVIVDRPGLLTDAEIEEAREEMRRIKFHPRDSLPNRTALARADALFAELSGMAREELMNHIAAFRAALESQDPTAIVTWRERLVAVTGAYRR